MHDLLLVDRMCVVVVDDTGKMTTFGTDKTIVVSIGTGATEKPYYYKDFKDDNAHDIEFEPMDFDDPLYIMYSSGTTGLPKCMVQSQGGVLLHQKKELVLPSDVFNLVSMALAELQTIKAYRDLKHYVTPPAVTHERKKTNDVHQLLRWVTRMLRQIRQV